MLCCLFSGLRVRCSSSGNEARGMFAFSVTNGEHSGMSAIEKVLKLEEMSRSDDADHEVETFKCLYTENMP